MSYGELLGFLEAAAAYGVLPGGGGGAHPWVSSVAPRPQRGVAGVPGVVPRRAPQPPLGARAQLLRGAPGARARALPRPALAEREGRPRFVPAGWGAAARPWVAACVAACPGLEELRLKRMVVTDGCLKLLACSFPNLKSLVLVGCQGFSTDGLATVATNCR